VTLLMNKVGKVSLCEATRKRDENLEKNPGLAIIRRGGKKKATSKLISAGRNDRAYRLTTDILLFDRKKEKPYSFRVRMFGGEGCWL